MVRAQAMATTMLHAALAAAGIVVPFAGVYYFLHRGKSTTDDHAGGVQADDEGLVQGAEGDAQEAPVPPLLDPLLAVPERPVRRMTVAELRDGLAQIPGIYARGVANGRASEVAWIHDSGLLHCPSVVAAIAAQG